LARADVQKRYAPGPVLVKKCHVEDDLARRRHKMPDGPELPVGAEHRLLIERSVEENRGRQADVPSGPTWAFLLSIEEMPGMA
jgi:hypothetical protein